MQPKETKDKIQCKQLFKQVPLETKRFHLSYSFLLDSNVLHVSYTKVSLQMLLQKKKKKKKKKSFIQILTETSVPHSAIQKKTNKKKTMCKQRGTIFQLFNTFVLWHCNNKAAISVCFCLKVTRNHSLKLLLLSNILFFVFSALTVQHVCLCSLFLQTSYDMLRIYM